MDSEKPSPHPIEMTVGRRRALRAGLLAALGLAVSGPGAFQSPSAAAADTDANPLSNPRTRMAHLLRRAGFGATADELTRYEAMGFEASVDHLLNYEDIPDPIEDRLALLDLDLTKQDHLRRWWLVRMAHTTRPLQEKMVLFWHGLLTSSLQKGNNPSFMLNQNQYFREHALGSFWHILLDISKDPAMLYWLDGRNSRKEHPNENYARELMELFTMGIGHYTEQDVREAARAFTGWTVDKDGQVVFRPRVHDNGDKSFLGQTGKFDGDGIVSIIVGQAATAEYISSRLFSFFAYRNPEPAVVRPLAETYVKSGFSIKAVVRAILLSDAFSSAKAYRAIVKSPVELAVSTLRMLGITTDGNGLTGPLRAMGQDIFAPPNVAGWPGGPAWLNSSTWLQRVNFANAITTRRTTDPAMSLNFARLIQESGASSPQALVQHSIDLLLDGSMASAARDAIESYLFRPQALSLSAQSLNTKGRDLLYLLLASPEYQVM